MARWFREKRLWAGLIGTTAAFGLAFGQTGTDAPAGPPKVGDVISLQFRDGPDRQFKVLKVEKQADGSYLSEVKDTKTGEVITLVDKASEAAEKPPEPIKSKETVQPKAKPRPSDPLLPPSTAPDNVPEKTQPASGAKKSASSNSASTTDSTQDPPKKPGLFSRIFGPKKPTPPANGNATNGNGSAPTVTVPATTMPPPVKATPGSFPSSSGSSTAEPPRFIPSQQSPSIPTPPVQTIPVPVTVPPLPSSSAPATPPIAPSTTPSPSGPPAPMIPGLPSIPIPPGGTSKNSTDLIQVRFVSSTSAVLIKDIQPFVTALCTARAPSERVYAVRALAECRHGSTDTVKSVIFHACLKDPCPLVRASCIDELCKLGYFESAFISHLYASCDDPSQDVRDSARAAIQKMAPKRQ